MTKRFLFILCIPFMVSQVTAQRSSIQLKKANKELKQLRYAFAIPYYQQYLKQAGINPVAFKNLAICYFKTNQYDSAIVYFEKAVQSGIVIENQLAELYANKGQYQLAITQYQKIKEHRQTLLTDARLFGFMHLEQFYQDSLDYQVNFEKLNSSFNDFGAIPYKDGLVFISNRNEQEKKKLRKSALSGWDGQHYTQLYYNNQKDSSSQLFSPLLKNKLNTGSISFTSDFKQAFFTKNASKRGKASVYQLEIWASKWKDGKWDKPKKLFFNNPGFSYSQPAITPDGKRLYFVSNDTTGFGGTDIYYVDRNIDGSWQSTQNAGQVINTTGNELFPSFYDGTLFFSSNGHAGIGGLDIYRVARDSKGELEVKHMGYPVNSTMDDFTFSINGNRGYFSSNRKGNDDVYAFEFNRKMVDLAGSIVLDTLSIVRPIVYLTQVDPNGNVSILDSTKVDAQGKYQFKARPNRALQLLIKDAYAVAHRIDINTNNFQNNNINELVKNIEPIQLRLPEEIVIARKQVTDSIKATDLAVMPRQFKRAIDSLATMSSDFTVLHHPFDQVYVIKEDLNAYYKLIERVKKMQGKKIVIVSAADCTGDENYNDDLSKRRANRIYKTLSKLGDNIVEIKSVGEMELIEPCNISRQDLNRYSYIYILDK